MNIPVLTSSGLVYCRPDTTLEKEDKDLFAPDAVEGYGYAPVLFMRISKAGKCIGRKFADRYYESIGYGILLYVGDDLACGSCFDHTSILPGPLYSKHVLEKQDNIFRLKMDGEEIYRTEVGEDAKDRAEAALEKVSRIVSLRIGDYLAIELEDVRPLVGREKERTQLEAEFCENPSFDFSIVF